MCGALSDGSECGWFAEKFALHLPEKENISFSPVKSNLSALWALGNIRGLFITSTAFDQFGVKLDGQQLLDQ
jgi:hypothetical protein